MSRPKLYSGVYGASKPKLLWVGNQNMTAGILSRQERLSKPSAMVTATEAQKRIDLTHKGGNFENGGLSGFSKGEAAPVMMNRTRSRFEQEVRKNTSVANAPASACLNA